MAEEKKPTGQEKKEESSKAAGTAKKSTTKAASTKKATKRANELAGIVAEYEIARPTEDTEKMLKISGLDK